MNIEKLQYFVGKPCTIFTIEVNFRFKQEQMIDYFHGVIDSIDEHGVFLTHNIAKTKTFIALSYIVGITEEQILYEDNPEHTSIIEEYRKEKPITAAKHVVSVPLETPKHIVAPKPNFKDDSPFMNPKAMAELIKKSQENKKSKT